MKKHDKAIIKAVSNTLLSWKMQGTTILRISKSTHLIEVALSLPNKYKIEYLENCLINLCEQLNCNDYRISSKSGKILTIIFSKGLPDEIPFDNSFINNNSLKVTMISSFDTINFDFEDGASCHMLTGGAPRMGKTFALLYLATMIYIQNKGKLDLYIISEKNRDFYPFENKQNVKIIPLETDFDKLLKRIISVYKRRNALLHKYPSATDSKTIKEMYPHAYKYFRPIFIIIDEYAQYSENKQIQKNVGELVRVSGYLNIHIIISTQRPEARYTVPANIKMGLMLRLCLPVADTNNSIIVLDEEGAEKLPRIKGRAILKDGESTIVQIPKMDYITCTKLLQPYERIEQNDSSTKVIQSNARSSNTELSSQIQNMFTQSTSLHDLSEQHQPNQRMQSNHEKTILKWSMPSSPSIKR